MAKKQYRVLIALGWYDYRLHRGMERYAEEHGWRLYSNYARERLVPWGWDGDGILAWLGEGDDLAEFAEQTGKPTVDFSFRRPHLKFPRVLEDHQHAAGLVAEHFLSRGLRNFAFYTDAANWSYQERGQGFVDALKGAGHECAMLAWYRAPEYEFGRNQWTRKRKWLTAQLKRLPKPVAVFAASDEQALDVLDSCESAGLAVPEEVSIVGAEDYRLAPEAMHTPISSVDTNLESLGYRGAKLLDDLMRGKKPPREPIRVPALGIITRKSSDLLAVTHQGVARSLRFIAEHSHELITVNDLVQVAAMSRRGLHKAFVDSVGRTPGAELKRVRIERAKRILSTSNHKIEAVANMCGYQCANSFCVAFKQTTGLSPKQFRDEFRH